MDNERNDFDKIEEVMLPGFRFHPTDEELVGFYLRRKILQKPLSIELIKQLDIYKYDPWDLPKLATTGEKEWYFYCPRDRKYRNSARPNRVTGAGFWKATGTDRPIYSSEGNKCIGLKKSLVFYKGRAAKGIKTDWMMHEFRLPSLADSATAAKKFTDKSLPANDSWAICRIFKKTNSTAQRALSQSWISPVLTEPGNTPDILSKDSYTSQFSLHSVPLTTDTSSAIQLNYNTDQIQHCSTTTAATTTNISPFDFTYKPISTFASTRPHSQLPVSNAELTSNNFLFSPLETFTPAKCTVDVSSMLLNMSSSVLGDFGNKVSESGSTIDFGGSQHVQDHSNDFSSSSLPQVTSNVGNGYDNISWLKNQNMHANLNDQWESIGFPFSLPVSMGESWKQIWDSSSCPSEISTTSSITKCYT